MSYVVNNSRGQIVAVVEDGTINTSATSITLVGKSYTPYGEPIAENFVYMLENFANYTEPDDPIVGQLWWDMTNNALKSYTGSTWSPVSGITVASTAPVIDVNIGDIWFDTTIQRFKVYTDLGGANYAWIGINAISAQAAVPVSANQGELYFNTTSQQLFIWSNGAWLLVGPENVAGFGATKWISTSLRDTYNVYHAVIMGTVNGVVTVIMSSDSFTIKPTDRPTGFVDLIPGINAAIGCGFTGYFIGDLTGNVSGYSTNVTGVVSSVNGGTGQSTYNRGQVLVGNVAGMLARANITGNGAITVTASNVNDDLIVSYTGGTGYGNVTSVGLTAGTGISVSGGPITESGNIQVTNTGVTSVTGGTGVSVSQGTGDVVLSTNVVGNGAISVASGAGNSLVVSYTGGTGVGNVTSVGLTAGTGISVSGGPITTSGSITVTNAGVTSVTGGTGVSVSQGTGDTVLSTNITGSGPISVASGVGNSLVVSYTGGTGVGNVTSVGITAGTGISVSGGPITTNGNITVTNNGVTSITAGSGISVSQSSGAVTITNSGQIPSGVIVMWSGSNANIPSGWALCDGTNGTPDLRNRFIVGSGGSFNTNATGGSFNLSISTGSAGTHDHGGNTAEHTLTIGEIPNHNHSINNAIGSASGSAVAHHYAYNASQIINATGYTGGGLGHSHDILAGGAHTHSVTGTYTPPYYALAYIMKL